MKTKNHTLSRRFTLAGLTACLSGALLFASPPGVQAVEKQIVPGYAYLQQFTSALAAGNGLDPAQRLHVTIGLPLRDQEGMNRLLQELYDPASPRFHQWMTPGDLAAKYAPTPTDYQQVVDWAVSKGLTVTATHPNLLVVEVEGSVADIQNAFNVSLQMYQHPTEPRQFFAPNTDPSIDLPVRVVEIDGLSDFVIMHPNSHATPAPTGVTPNGGGPTPNGGSGPSGLYGGCDFRAAYAPGTPLRGLGESVGLVQFDAFVATDISAYASFYGVPLVPQTVVAVNGGGTLGGGQGEVTLDIDMSMAMAPGLSMIYVYEAPNSIANFIPILSRMQTDNLSRQLSCSWTGPGAISTFYATGEAIFQNMAAQGQSFFNASGDEDALISGGPFPSESPSITLVGGTQLLTTGPCGSYSSETVWQEGGGLGSTGGVSTNYSIPWWQQGIDMTANQGSTALRNSPDVALTATNIHVILNGTSYGFRGTSCASPLWAGFTALCNEQAANHSRAGLGLLNPVLYAAGKNNTNATAFFHDVTTGNNQRGGSGSHFPAVVGYDLCTGWGSPAGQGLINYLSGTFPTVPNGGFEAGSLAQWQIVSQVGLGVLGAPYAHSGNYGLYLDRVGALDYIYQELATTPGQNYVLSFWLKNFGGPTNEFYVYCNGVQLDLVNAAAFDWTLYQFVIPATSTTTFLEIGGRQDPSTFALDDVTLTPLPGNPEVNPRLPLNGGFETGTFANWAVGGGAYIENYPPLVHGGTYTAGFGPVGVTNVMTQTIPTVPGQTYRLQFWLMNNGGSANDFGVWWNGTQIYELANEPTFPYGQYNFNVTATSSSTVLQFSYRNDPAYYYLDDVTLTPLLGTTLGQGAYVRSTLGEPWGVNNNRNAMDRVFGAGNWNDERFETVDPNVLFSPSVHCIFMDGSQSGATAMSTFLNNNAVLMQNWVSSGGSLYLNCAPTTGGSFGMGFGVTLNYTPTMPGYFSGGAFAANPANPIFQAPFNPVGTSWTGNFFSHASVSGAGLVPIIVNTNAGNPMVLAEMNYGSGHVMFGGLTTDNWHSPVPQAQNLTANILEYGNLSPMGMFDDLPNLTFVPNGYRGVNWNSFAVFNGSSAPSSGYAPGTISQPNCVFNNGGGPASITSPTPFNLFSAWITAAWNDNLTLEAKGFVNGVLTYDEVFILSATTPQFVPFDMLGVTEVDFVTSGGTPHPGYTGGGFHMAMDDVTLTLAPAQPGGVDHYGWSSISSPQCMNAAFPVTITARDINNNVATSFNGQVAIAGFNGGALIDGFETGVWPAAPWVNEEGPVGGVAAAFAHDGGYALSDPGWFYRTDVSIGTAGEALSWWVRPYASQYGGRAYLGFGASASGAWSAVTATDTSGLIIQHNAGYGFSDVATVAQTYLPGQWYRVEVKFNSTTSVTVNLYDSDGTTLLNTVSYGSVTGLPGGIAVRSYGNGSILSPPGTGWALDTIRRGSRNPVQVTPTITANFLNGVWSGSVEVLQAANNMYLTAINGIGDNVGSSNPFDNIYDPPLVGPITLIPGGISLTWNTCPGGRYQVQYTTSLFPPPVAWTNLGSPITAAGNTLTINDLFSGPYRFYRIIMLP